MKTICHGDFILKNSDQLAALLKACYKTELPISIRFSFDFFCLLYKAIEEEKIAPNWFISNDRDQMLFALERSLTGEFKDSDSEEDEKEEWDSDKEEQIQTVRFFISEVEALKPKVETNGVVDLYKISGELREILGSEWLIKKDLVSLDTLKSFISHQITCRKLKTSGNKVYLDEHLKKLFQTQAEYMFHDQILRKLKEGLIKNT